MGWQLKIGTLRWVHIVPLIHLLVCFVAASGYVVPALGWLGILFSVLFIADFPISIVYVAMAFGNLGGLGFIWLVVAGTLWWYVLCRSAERAAAALRARRWIR